MCQYQIVATFHHSLEKSSVSITDGTGALDVTIAHSAMEQLFDYAFPIKNVLKMKKELKEGFLRKKITFQNHYADNLSERTKSQMPEKHSQLLWPSYTNQRKWRLETNQFWFS